MRFPDANECPIMLEDVDVDILKTIALEAIGLEGRTLVGRLSGDSNPV